MELIKGAPGAADQQPLKQPPQRPQQSSPQEEIRQEIDKLDPYGETITLTYQLRQFADFFKRRIYDDQSANACFNLLNEAALDDNKFAVKLAMVFGSHQLGDLISCEKKIRNAMIGMLQQNFLAIERLKQDNLQRFYNSVTLLGEYYFRKKVAGGKRINILGQSLLLLLTSELEQEITKSTKDRSHQMDAEFAKLVLEQVTLNGAVAKDEHRKEIVDLLFTIRKALITLPNLCARAKAFLLMSLDMYHGNLAEDLLERLYNKYLNAPAEQPVRNGSNEPVESVRGQPSEAKQAVNGECTTVRASEKTSPEPVAAPTEVGIRTNSISRDTGGKTPSPQHVTHDKDGIRTNSISRDTGAKTPSPQHVTHDKENKRRSSSRGGGVVTTKKTSPTARNVRLGDDGAIVATISRKAPNSPTKKNPPPPPVQSYRPERSAGKRNLPPRLERLAALPKIAVTSSTPSPKGRHGNPAPTSPRAILGVSSAKQQQQQQKQQQPQQPQHPPKSPIRTMPTPRSAPEGKKSPDGGTGTSRVSTAQGGWDRDGTNRSGMTPRNGSTAASNGHGTQQTGKRTPPPKIRPPSPFSWATELPLEQPLAQEEDTSCKDSSRLTNGTNGNAATAAAAGGAIVSNGTASNRTGGSAGSGNQGTEKEATAKVATGGATKPKVKTCIPQEQEEMLSWNAMCALDEDSPQKMNPHTKSFLSFLADN